MESLKAYIRGQVISYVAHRNRDRSKRLKDLIHSIADLDRRHALSPVPDPFKEKSLFQFKFNVLSRWKTEENILKSTVLL